MPGKFNRQTYVTVQERVNAFREEHPNGEIKTTLHSLTGGPEAEAIFMAFVDTGEYTDASSSGLGGRQTATGWGSETRADFPGAFLEKAETKAIGRALANLGYANVDEGRASVEEMESYDRRSQRYDTQQRQQTAPPAQPSAQPPAEKSGPTTADILGLDLSNKDQQEIWSGLIAAANKKEGDDQVAEWRKLAKRAEWSHGRTKEVWRFVDLCLAAPTESVLKGIYDMCRKAGIDNESLDLAVDQRSGELRNGGS